MSHILIDKLPAFIEFEGSKYFLSLNKAEDGLWCAGYVAFGEVDDEGNQVQLLLCGYLNDCVDLDEVFVRMSKKLERGGYVKTK